VYYNQQGVSKRQFLSRLRRQVNRNSSILMRRKVYPSRLARLRPTEQRYLTNPVQRRIVSQLKSAYDSATFTVPNNGWAVRTICSGITQGPSSNLERIGDRINFQKIYGRLIVQSEDVDGTERWPITESNNGVIFRVVIVEDKQSNGNAATASQVFDTAFSTANTVQQFNNLSNTERFRILHDQIVNMAQGQFPGGMVEFYLKPNVITKYNVDATTGAVADILTGNILMFITCQYAASMPATGTVGLTVKSHIRLRFTDL